MTANTLEREDLFVAFEYDFTREIHLADCECTMHDAGHSAPGQCGKAASWRLTAKALMGLYTPVVSQLLCRECLDSHVAFIEASRPTLEITVRPI